MEACIIGAGFSGISTGKVCLDYGLIPFILDKSPGAGGLWNGFEGVTGVWNSLSANTSKHLSAFSDFLWPAEDPDFPTAKQVLNYLLLYIEKHRLAQYLHFGCEVIEVDQYEEDYKVTWKFQDQVHSKVFKYVIVASGRYSRQEIPFENAACFTGTIIKPGVYREPSVFAGKKVVTIGKSYSGSDIALEALETASSVSQIYRKPYICIPTYVMGSIPYDYMMHRVEMQNWDIKAVNELEQNERLCRADIEFYGNPSQYLPEWEITDSMLRNEFVKNSTHRSAYFSAVKDKRINCIQGTAADFYENGVVLSDGTRVEAEVVVPAMRYTTDYGYLSKKIQEVLQYDEKDMLTPTIMYRALFHPNLPRFAFVGNFDVGAPGKFELQAEISVRYLIGTLQLGKEEVEQGIRDELHIRNDLRDLAFPYDYIGYLLDCLRILKVKIDLELLNNEFGYRNGPLLPYFFFMDRPGQKEICRAAINEMREKHPNFNWN